MSLIQLEKKRDKFILLLILIFGFIGGVLIGHYVAQILANKGNRKGNTKFVYYLTFPPQKFVNLFMHKMSFH